MMGTYVAMVHEWNLKLCFCFRYVLYNLYHRGYFSKQKTGGDICSGVLCAVPIVYLKKVGKCYFGFGVFKGKTLYPRCQYNYKLNYKTF